MKEHDIKAVAQMMDAQVNTPQFPGMQKGASINQVRSFIKKQKRIKGFAFDLATGSNEFDIKLSGTARIFLGFALFPVDAPNPPNNPSLPDEYPEQHSLTLNNEVIIDQTHSFFFSPSWMDDEYYFVPRPLSGQDDFTLTFFTDIALTLYYAAYYI